MRPTVSGCSASAVCEENTGLVHAAFESARVTFTVLLSTRENVGSTAKAQAADETLPEPPESTLFANFSRI